MKYIFSILFFTQLIYAQNTDFSSVIIEYEHSWSSSSLTHKIATGEKIKLVKKRNRYIFKSFDKIERFDKTRKCNEIFSSQSVERLSPISKDSINLLFSEISQDKSNFSSNYFLPLIKPPSDSLLDHITKYFPGLNKKSEITLRSIHAKIKGFDAFEEYCETQRPTATEFYGTMDGNTEFTITFRNKSNQWKYKLQTFYNLGQPIFFMVDNNLVSRVTNLDVNKIMLSLLPDNSLIRSQFEFQNIVEKYIIWYLQNKI